jgi:hypothetical protein
MLGKLFKRRLLPGRLRPAFSRTERVLAWALTPSGTAVIATNLRLWVAGSGTQWNEISKATWDGNALTVVGSKVVEERDGYSVIADQEPVRLVLTDPGHLPHEVRQRVTASVRHPARHEVDGTGFWLAARRVPGVDGLSWIVRYDSAADAASSEVIALTDELVAETRSRVVTPGG